MCEPLSIATGAMAIGSAVMQQQQARTQARLQNSMAQANQTSAIASLGDTYATNGVRLNQETQAASDAIWERNRQALIERSSANAAAGDAGVTGVSVDRILGDILGSAGRDNATTQQNLRMTGQQIGRENVGARASALSQINSVPRAARPSGWATAFNIGSAGLNAYSTYSARTGSTPVEDWWGRQRAGQQGKDFSFYNQTVKR